jgi:hypothetical protein
MKHKCVTAALAGAILLVVLGSAFAVIDTSDIDEVRNKQVLDPDSDFEIIDNFVGFAALELIKVRDFSDIAKVRQTILERSSSRQPSAQPQYRGPFYESAHKHLSAAFEKLERLEPDTRRFMATANILILIDRLLVAKELDDLKLADLALTKVGDDSTVISYLAVRAVTNSEFTENLKKNDKTVARIAGRLQQIMAGSSPEVIAASAAFAGQTTAVESRKLLLQIAEMRLTTNAQWKVEHESLDGDVLRALSEEITSVGSASADVARNFAQLYSYVLQRYIRALDGGYFRSDAARRRTISVLVDVERSCMSKLLSNPQSAIKKAIERRDVSELRRQHDRLFGSASQTGELGRVLHFDYGANADGSKRIGPLVLPEPPKPASSQ